MIDSLHAHEDHRSFRFGTHVIEVGKLMEGRWNMRVDGCPCAFTYRSSADAWAAGVQIVVNIQRCIEGADALASDGATGSLH